MQKTKPLEKGSFLRSVLHALGMDRSSAAHLPTQDEAQLGVSVSNADYVSTRTAFLEAEHNKGKAIMELRRKPIV